MISRKIRTREDWMNNAAVSVFEFGPGLRLLQNDLNKPAYGSLEIVAAIEDQQTTMIFVEVHESHPDELDHRIDADTFKVLQQRLRALQKGASEAFCVSGENADGYHYLFQFHRA